MIELNKFYNDGFGWFCRACANNLKTPDNNDKVSRLMREGEAESKIPRFSSTALAKWADPGHRILMCPLCGITESADNS